MRRQLKLNLSAFCRTKASLRPDAPGLNKPFAQGRYVYATDGHVMLRVSRQRFPGVETQKLPDMKKFEFNHNEVIAWFAMPTEPTHVTRDENECPLVQIGGRWFDFRLVKKFLNATELPEIDPHSLSSAVRVRFTGGLGYIISCDIVDPKKIEPEAAAGALPTRRRVAPRVGKRDEAGAIPASRL